MNFLQLLWKLLFAFALLSVVTYANEDEGEDGDELADGDEEGDDSPEQFMKQMDTDGDGKLTMEEIFADPEAEIEEEERLELEKQFNKADADGDKKVDAKELAELFR